MALNTSSSAVIRSVNNGFVVVSAKYIPANATIGAAAYFDEEETYYAAIADAVTAITAVFS